jgi:hypothetical protein|tara:strand:+ start:183 stop:386 length:204 start_codon:yes stop_codon:yes gene_type:complete
MIPVEGHKNLFRDENSGAIVNCDTMEYNQYIKMKNERQKQKEEISELKKDVQMIKNLLMELVDVKSR